MKKIEIHIRKGTVAFLGKLLTICGVALTFAACYGVMEPDMKPEYFSPERDQMLYGGDENEDENVNVNENKDENENKNKDILL